MIGVDLGTTKSVACRLADGQPHVVSDRCGRRTMPSVVMVEADQHLHVGWDAVQHPARYSSQSFTVSSIKRLMGRVGESRFGSMRVYRPSP